LLKLQKLIQVNGICTRHCIVETTRTYSSFRTSTSFIAEAIICTRHSLLKLQKLIQVQESLQDIALLKLQELIEVLEPLQALLLKPESVQDIHC
jgi:hypothetical protein